jgi:hypothetical protein
MPIFPTASAHASNSVTDDPPDNAFRREEWPKTATLHTFWVSTAALIRSSDC